MTYQEIADHYRKVFDCATSRINEKAHTFGSLVKKTRQYPLRRVFKVQTKDKVVLNLAFIANKRDEWNHPKLSLYSTFYKNGLYAISMDIRYKIVYLYTPHFFDRYEERIVKNDGISREDIIKRFMLTNQDMLWYKNATVFSKQYEKYERESVTQLAARVEEGNCFVDRLTPNTFILRTVLSDEDLEIGPQTFAFSQLEQMRKFFAERNE